MEIHRLTLVTMMDLAIKEQENFERMTLKYTSDSIMLAVWRDIARDIVDSKVDTIHLKGDII